MSGISGGEVIRLVGMIGLLAGCVPAHPYSMQVDGERVVVDVLKPDEL
ncbi:MAG: hypothetical protein KF876_11730 [Nitrospira sp.]|nr:hypothetical protein [Nitrospira sp.]